MILDFTVRSALSSALLAASTTMASGKSNDEKIPVIETNGAIMGAVRDARAKKSPLTINDIHNLFVPKKLEAKLDSFASVNNNNVMHALNESFLREENPTAFDSEGTSTNLLHNSVASRNDDGNDTKISLSSDFDSREELGILSVHSTPSDPTANEFDGATVRESFEEQIHRERSHQRKLQAVNCGGDYPLIGAGSGGYPSEFDFQTLIQRCLNDQPCPYSSVVSCWDTSKVTDMSEAFKRQYDFNQDLSGWDTAKVTDMEGMFYFATSFDKDISSWDVGKVTNFESTFSVAYAFNQDISGWDTSKVTTMEYTFAFAKSFDQDISSWDTSNVSNFAYMLETTPFNKNIANWDTSKATAMQYMFYRASSFNQDISSWDVGNVLNFQVMFKYASSFNQCLSSWAPNDYCVLTRGMFSDTSCPYTYTRLEECPFDSQDGRWCQGPIQGCNVGSRCDDNYPLIGGGNGGYGTFLSFQDLVETCLRNDCPYTGSISCWNTSLVTDMSYAFFRKQGIDEDISAWDTSAVTDMRGIFYYAKSFNQDLKAWNMSNVADFSSMFLHASSFNQDISSWDTSAVTSMYFMFYYADSFNQNLSPWNTASVSNFMYTFEDAKAFNSDLSDWNMSEALTTKYMFAGADSFNQDIGSWDVGKVTNMEKMFLNAKLFNQAIATWDTSKVETFEGMFRYASSFNQCLSDWAPTINCVVTSEMFQGSGCPYNIFSPQACPSDSDQLRWCRGPEQNCNAVETCRDTNDEFRMKVVKKRAKKASKARRTSCAKVSKEGKSKRNKTCKNSIESGRQRVSDVCPETCGKC
mmetsp:Transcript_10813/g.25995  ORF Transcript_10813/g.25995 Transcript_10813/m.25995 type:complete len:808 (+) Transcript_10813:106-2529(+)